MIATGIAYLLTAIFAGFGMVFLAVAIKESPTRSASWFATGLMIGVLLLIVAWASAYLGGI